MSETLRQVVYLVQAGEGRISAHGYDEMAEDGILAGEVIEGSVPPSWLRTTQNTRRGCVLCRTRIVR